MVNPVALQISLMRVSFGRRPASSIECGYDFVYHRLHVEIVRWHNADMSAGLFDRAGNDRPYSGYRRAQKTSPQRLFGLICLRHLLHSSDLRCAGERDEVHSASGHLLDHLDHVSVLRLGAVDVTKHRIRARSRPAKEVE